MSDTRVVQVPIRMGPMSVNAYLLVGRHTVVVDTGVAGQEARILAALAAEGRAPTDVSLILLTHGHQDHTGSVRALVEATGAPVALGAGDEERAASGADLEMRGRGRTGAVLVKLIRSRPARPAGSPPVMAPADIVVSSETSLSPWGVDAVVTPTPGHTRGSLSVFTDSGEAVVGDILGGGGRSSTRPKRGIFVSDEAAMDAGIRAIVARAPRLTWTGHDAGPFTLDAMKAAFPEMA